MALWWFELVRVIVALALARAYEKYRGPAQAAAFVAIVAASVVAYGGMCFLLYCSFKGFSSTVAAPSRPWIWEALLVPAAVIAAEGAVGLLFFRDDVRAQAARLGAMADALTWFVLAFLAGPLLAFALVFVIALMLKSAIWQVLP